jgi:hypothetical protein
MYVPPFVVMSSHFRNKCNFLHSVTLLSAVAFKATQRAFSDYVVHVDGKSSDKSFNYFFFFLLPFFSLISS